MIKRIIKKAYKDELIPEAAADIIACEMASATILQLLYKIDSARAERIMCELEELGVISKSHDILMTMEEWVSTF